MKLQAEGKTQERREILHGISNGASDVVKVNKSGGDYNLFCM